MVNLKQNISQYYLRSLVLHQKLQLVLLVSFVAAQRIQKMLHFRPRRIPRLIILQIFINNSVKYFHHTNYIPDPVPGKDDWEDGAADPPKGVLEAPEKMLLPCEDEFPKTELVPAGAPNGFLLGLSDLADPPSPPRKPPPPPPPPPLPPNNPPPP